MKTALQQFTFRLLRYLHLIPPDLVMMNEFDLIRGGVEKQLDEYRELLETLERETGYFSSSDAYFMRHKAVTLDDFLSHVYQLRYQHDPTPNQSTPWSHCRSKPSFLEIKE
ncbi:hypothetical protein ACSYON_004044 [Vibrio vulnificus]|nr:hypothetical protein [Vibrio vulnificus]MCU8386796.1 hypothetical protein [Vibrio vulnificus]